MLDLYLLTFNCARNFIDPAALAPSLFAALAPSTPVPDIVAISLQEVSPIAYAFLGGSYLDAYFERVHETVHRAVELRSNGATDADARLQHLGTKSLGMTALMVFARPEIAERMRWMQCASAGVGLWDMGNKGAVALRLGIMCPREEEEEIINLTFTSAHLAPFEANVGARNRDWEVLVRNLVFENDEGSRSGSHVSLARPGEVEAEPLLASNTSPEEAESQGLPEGMGLFAFKDAALFVAGDLNYRTSDAPPTRDLHHPFAEPHDDESGPPPPDTITSSQQYKQLLEDDQLTRELEAGRTLHHLNELPITFPPTYKITHSSSPDSDDWKWAPHRYPSWCDRILFHASDAESNGGSKMSRSSLLEPLRYDVLPVQRTSDHRPVALSVRIHDERLAESKTSIGAKAPFPINPNWRQRRDSARRLELLVGVASYLALTTKGRTIILGALGVVVGTWWVLGWIWD